MAVDSADQLLRVLRFLDAVAVDRATSVVPVPGGYAVLNSDFPAAHNLNRLIISDPCPASELAAAADAVLGGAGLAHRQIDVHDAAVADQLSAGLAERGYASSRELVMAMTAPVAGATALLKPAAVPEQAIVELGVPERADVASADWHLERPEWDDDVVDQLGRRIGTVLAAAETTFLAVRNRNGRVVARADLYLRDGVGQVEEVMTDPIYQGRGFASRLVREAASRALLAAADPIFLLADGDDWPQHLYRRLGFADLGTTTSFTAQPQRLAQV